MIFHYSHAPIRKEIESSGFIGLEGCRLEYFIDAGLHLGQPRSSELSYQWRSCKKKNIKHVVVMCGLQSSPSRMRLAAQMFLKLDTSMTPPKLGHSRGPHYGNGCVR